YGEARTAALTLAEGLLRYDLGPDRPLAILSANSIDHALIMLAALYVGIPLAPIAPAYALQTTDYLKLAHAFRLLTPGMIVLEDGEIYRYAIEQALKTDPPVVALRNASTSPRMIDVATLRGDGSRREAVLTAASCVGQNTVAKYLFTSGSTGMPKAVI